MATPLDVTLVPLAAQLLARYGTNVTISRVTPGTYDPATQATTADVTKSQVIKAVAESPSLTAPAGILVPDADWIVTMPARGLIFAPAEGDTVTLYNTAYRVAKVAPIPSGDEIAAYQVALRGPA